VNVPAVRQALADALTDTGWNVTPYVLAQPTPPGIQIIPPGRIYDYSVGLDEWQFVVQAFVSLNTDLGAQMMLDELCTAGASSVKTLLEQDDTLGGLVDSLRVTDQSPGRQVEQPPGNPMLLVEWRVTILG
jgi:hypothetical protein